MEGFNKPKQEKPREDWEEEQDQGVPESQKKSNGIGYALAFGAGVIAGGYVTEKAADYAHVEQDGKNTTEVFKAGGELTAEEADEMKKYEVILGNGEKTTVTLERAEPVNVNLEGSKMTNVDLTGSEKVSINPENPDSNPSTVELQASKKVRIDPVNPDSNPVRINL